MAAKKLRADVFVEPENDPRTEPPTQGDEKETLVGFLRFMRETLELKCSELDADQLARRAVEPSTMSLLGMVRHMADVERGWFRRFMNGQDAPPIFYSRQENPDGDWDGAVADPAVIDEAWQAWRDEIAFADEYVAAAPDLGVLGRRPDGQGEQMSLRWVLTHMIEEYGRHPRPCRPAARAHRRPPRPVTLSHDHVQSPCHIAG